MRLFSPEVTASDVHQGKSYPPTSSEEKPKEGMEINLEHYEIIKKVTRSVMKRSKCNPNKSTRIRGGTERQFAA